MRLISRVLGSLALFLAGVALLLAIATWPPGGLMFAAPYVFLFLAIPLAVVGALLLFVGRAPAERTSADRNAMREPPNL